MSLNNMEHLKINARTQVQEEEDEKERTLSLLQDNGTVKRSAAESKALMRRIYSKIDKDTTRDELLKIMQMPQSGWFIERVRVRVYVSLLTHIHGNSNIFDIN